MSALTTHVKFVKGIGPRIAESLAQRGVETVEDLLYHLPFRYEDRLHPRPIAELRAGEMASIIGEVRGSALLRTRHMPLFEMTVGQGLSTVKCMWFHGSYLKDKFRPGQMVALYGKLEPSRSRPGNFKMIQPQFDILPSPDDKEGTELALPEIGRIVPIYETLGGTTQWGSKLGSRWFRRVIWGLLEELSNSETPIDEVIPASITKRLGLPPRLRALREAHFPEAGTRMEHLQSFSTTAQQRLIFEELFYLELGLELKRKRLREREGITFATNNSVRNAIKEVLPFHPTSAQKRVLAEIVDDMRKPNPMRRLLQGDVGSGKTIVALQAALVAIENGYQAALMVPTEILATQHYLSARKLLERSSKQYKITLLTGSLDPAQKKQNRGKIFRGESELIIGTHALIQEKVDFANLGLIIVDEQHRFGVQQRFTLMKKPGTADPDVLVMTATPIPRTLALTIYGDLDVSVIDELPPGRTPILTRRTTDERALDVWEFVRKQIASGHQAYIVYPVIEGNKDDQPELDFPDDDATLAANEAASLKADEDAGIARKKAPAKKAAAKKSTTAKKAAKSTKTTEALFEKPALKAAAEMYEELRHGPLHGLRLGLLHGRMSADDKEVTMRRFQRGEIDVLISTTVIEVGVDVPNASIMVIEHAERFGMAQMHQLRGRVGRGAAKSYCVLMTGGKVSPLAEERLDAMVRTQNGFELAELDLQQRGPGEFFGTKQAGMPDFRVANIVRDRRMLELAKNEASAFAQQSDKSVTPAERDLVRNQLKQHWQRRYGLVEA